MADLSGLRRRVVAVPYPGRGHINPMLNFCNLILSKTPSIEISVILTEEWLQLLSPEEDDDPDRRLTFISIPNVLPSELVRGADLPGFLAAVQRDMRGPVERALDGIEGKLDLMIADSFVGWAMEVGERRKVKVAAFWPASVSAFTLGHFYDLLQEHSAGVADEDHIESIPGIAPIREADLPRFAKPNSDKATNIVVNIVASSTKAQCIIFRSLEALEAQPISTLRAHLPTPIFTIGLAIPYSKATLESNGEDRPNYISWLDSHSKKSVLYVALGSFLSTTGPQMDELAAGLGASGIPYLWVARGRARHFNTTSSGMVVPWCDQMRVLRHPSVGGFFTHCGWNSTVETAVAGVPVLTFPLEAEQTLNGKIMVEDWRIGWRVKNKMGDLMERGSLCELLKRFMDLELSERRDLDRASEDLKERVIESLEEDGSTSEFDGFLSKMITTCT